MARILRNEKDGSIVRIEFAARELAENVLHVKPERLAEWKKTIPPSEGQGEGAVYAVSSEDELGLLRQRAAVLNTNMTEAAVRAVERAGKLSAYAALAEDCPEGVTAHVWRSYGLIVLMQTKMGVMIGPEELAERASIVRRDPQSGKTVPDVDTATMHFRLLQALNLLSPGKDEAAGRWEHQGLPKSFQAVA